MTFAKGGSVVVSLGMEGDCISVVPNLVYNGYANPIGFDMEEWDLE